MDHGAWPFFVVAVLCLVNPVTDRVHTTHMLHTFYTYGTAKLSAVPGKCVLVLCPDVFFKRRLDDARTLQSYQRRLLDTFGAVFGV